MRFWLIRKLAGKHSVIMNTTFTPTAIEVADIPALIADNKFLSYPSLGVKQGNHFVEFHRLGED